MIERQLAQRGGEIGAGGDRLRQRRRHGDMGERAEKRARVVAGELELAGDAAVVDPTRQQRIELQPGRGLGRHGELHGHLGRIGRAAPELEAHRGAARDEVSRSPDLPGSRVKRHVGIDVLEALDAVAGTPGHGAILDREPHQGRDPGGGGRGLGLRRWAGAVRRGSRRRRAPVRRAIGQVLEIDLGLDQGGTAELDPARQQRQHCQLHFKRAQPYHMGGGSARRVRDTDVLGGDRRGRQQAEGDRPGKLDRVARTLAELRCNRGLEAVEIDELRRENEAGEDKDDEDAEQDCRFTQETSPGQAAP